jgi:malate synthase
MTSSPLVSQLPVEFDSHPEAAQVLSPEAQKFLVSLHEQFQSRRLELLEARRIRQRKIQNGVLPDFLAETRSIRDGEWKVAPAPKDLLDRRVEITGPAEPKMLINALNSGAKVFMADLEDALSPTWSNVLSGQVALMGAVRRTLSLEQNGKKYQLNPEIATLVVRPRGWHLEEAHFRIQGKPMSGSLLDFGLYFFHNAHELLKRGSGPYFYLPKMESHLEARLWNDAFNFAQDQLQIPRGTIRATVLIETLPAAFEMDEILFELREHASGLNAGRWDYIFSIIKKLSHSSDHILADRSEVTMVVPFMRAYTELLVKTCHRRNAHAMGGMAAFIPSRKDAEVTQAALKKVRDDKEREAKDGFDGTWVAHPDLVPVAREIFDRILGKEPHQKHRLREEVRVQARDLLAVMEGGVQRGRITLRGFQSNIEVALRYVERWLSGLGAVAIHHLMEDAATAEISRAQVWQWIRHGVKLEKDIGEGTVLATQELYRDIRDAELSRLKAEWTGPGAHRYDEASRILDALILNSTFSEFLTLVAYPYLDN